MLILLKSSYGTTDSNGGAVAGSKLHADGLSFTEPTAIKHVKKSDIQVLPVPFNDILHVQFEKPVNATYRIISVTGKTIKSGNDNTANLSISTGNLAKGCYILQIEHNGERYESMVVK
jgi:hypothetical protein